ncbi:MAG: hypothetical protein ACI87W_003412 [Halieaceae bacterium]
MDDDIETSSSESLPKEAFDSIWSDI